MDNYFQGCPPMMNDGRLFTDYRSSQVREELYRYNNCVRSENEARTLRIENANQQMDEEWEYLRDTRSCFPRKNCFHRHPSTRVTTNYNTAELLAYNGEIKPTKCGTDCSDYRLTATEGSARGRSRCADQSVPFEGYQNEKCPNRCAKTNRLMPDRLYTIDGKY